MAVFLAVVALLAVGYRYVSHGAIEAEYGRRPVGRLDDAKRFGLFERLREAAPATLRVGDLDVRVASAWVARMGNVRFDGLLTDRYHLVPRPERILCLELEVSREDGLSVASDAAGMHAWPWAMMELPESGAKVPLYGRRSAESLAGGRFRMVAYTDGADAREAFLVAGSAHATVTLK